jgi:hypothetical protein
MPSSQLCVKLHVGPKCISVPGGHALIGATGFFVRGIELAVGTAVVVQFSRGQEEISLRGTVSASYADLGLCVEFNERSGLTVHQLAALQEPEGLRKR